MPVTSLAAGRSMLVDHPTLRRIRPLENGFECDVKEEMYRGLASADMMVALGGVSMLGRRETASQNQRIHHERRWTGFRSGTPTPPPCGPYPTE
ncbi:MAG: hypothetical protein WD049_04905 [Candidatus Paceibacterota bacterium]